VLWSAASPARPLRATSLFDADPILVSALMSPILPFHIQVHRSTIVRALSRALFATPRKRGSAPALSNVVIDAFDDSLLKSSPIEMIRFIGEH
jgi:hypothetical protein